MRYKITTEDVKRIRDIRARMALESHYDLHRYLQQIRCESDTMLSRAGIRLKIENLLSKRQSA